MTDDALVAEWIDTQLAGVSLVRTGKVEQAKLRPWGAVLVAPTSGGRVWLKAPAPAMAFEVGLYALLHRVAPDRVLAPIAVDLNRGWILLPDGGPVLAERIAEVNLAEALTVILPQYAQLQRDLAPHVDAMLALGVSDMRAEVMPARFDEALEAVGRHVERRGRDAERETFHQVTARKDVFVSWCQRLSAAPGAASLDHNDLHPWNIFASAQSGAQAAKFFDWGDSVIAHPFATMLVALRYLGHHLGTDEADPAVHRARDAYLDVFSDLAPHRELVATMELACRVGKVARALVWHRALGTMEPDESDRPDESDESAPMAWLNSLLDDEA